MPVKVQKMLARCTTWAESVGANGERASFRDMDQRGADLANAYLSGADFGACDLTEANLSMAQLVLADFSSSKVTDCNLQQTELDGANLTKAILRRVDARYATIGKISIREPDG